MKNHMAVLFALTLGLTAPTLAADDTADIQKFLTAYDEAFKRGPS